jgi:crotonobetainyl-CoA:carnitine CoA-transferase CaiB-like acyl-CoA transferase
MQRSTIERAVRLGGLELPAGVDVEVTGDEPVLPSPHYLATGAAAARVLTGVAAAELWHISTGERQAVAVDARHAAAALRSYMHLRLLDRDETPGLADLARTFVLGGIVRARDGRYVQLHPSFNDGPEIIKELGLSEEPTRDEVEAAVGRRDAFELEAAFIGRRICGGVVMSKKEWADHPQGRAVADWPVVRVTKIGDAPPQPLPAGDRPTAGVRVLDLTRVLAGPTSAKTLAEHGADVLHVTAAHLERRRDPNNIRGALFDIETGIGKRQTRLDLNDPAQAETMRGLLAEADVFCQGYRLGSLARRGFGPEALAELRPGIVYVSENCYGHVGPWSERPGWEQLAQAATGMSHREGEATPGGVPQLAPAAVNDYTTGFLMAYGALVALARRAVEGGSWHVQASLSQTSTWYQRLGDDNDKDGADPGDPSPFTARMPTPDFGEIAYLAPALQMSATPPRWDLPPAPSGTHEPTWLPR